MLKNRDFLLDLIRLGGELSNSTLSEAIKLSGRSNGAVREALHRLTDDDLALRHKSDRKNGIDFTYSLTKKGRDLLENSDSSDLIFRTTPSLRQSKIVACDLFARLYLSSLPEITLEEGLYEGEVGWCMLKEERGEAAGDSKDLFRNNQAVGIIFLPKQIIILYCIRPNMRFNSQLESRITLELRRLIDYGELNGRYTPRDIFGVFHFLNTGTYLDWLMPNRRGGAKEIKRFMRDKFPRGNVIVSWKDNVASKKLLTDIFNGENILGQLKERFTGFLDRSDIVPGILADGTLCGAAVVSNPFADPSLINGLFSDILRFRRIHEGEELAPIVMLTLDSNKEIIRAVCQRRYPRSKPKFKVLGTDYDEWRQKIGLTEDWDGEK